MVKEIPDGLLDEIAAKLGAASVVIIACDSLIPCPDLLAGEGCVHGHDVICGSKGINGREQVADLLIKSAEAL